MPKFVVIPEDEGVALHGFNSREDFIDNVRYLIAEMRGDAVKLRELRRLRGESDWEETEESDKAREDRHFELIGWALAAQPGDMYIEKIPTPLKDYQITGRRVFCLNDTVGEVRWL